MSHWALKYIGQPWTPECNCYEWFRRITREQFGRDLPPIGLPPDHLARRAARIMSAAADSLFGYHPTAHPTEGDAVFLSSNGRTSHHIGMVIFPGRKMQVLHALDGLGVVVSDLPALRANGLSIQGFWTHETTAQHKPA
ncbi:hypothetical protein [Desulfuromonas thiophila]|uniref:hypothetical protein n=1 Tax=Desulfuromonas thiophila TaxID=57664 RepID=UPI0029F476C1|nr:hypothetical protein [Desulfuromonas thiophila]